MTTEATSEAKNGIPSSEAHAGPSGPLTCPGGKALSFNPGIQPRSSWGFDSPIQGSKRERVAQLTALVSRRLMTWRRSGEPKRWIGLDLGSTAVKLVELEQTADRVRLVRQLIQELPAESTARTPTAPDAGGSPSATPRPLDYVEWLHSALREFDAREVHLAVGGPEVAVRRIQIPPMSPRERAEAVKWQVKDHLPFPVQDAVLDFRVLGEVWDKDLKKLDVLVAAASKGFVQERIDLIERAGVWVVRVMPTHLALWSCLRTFLPEMGGGSVAVMELGAKTTHVAIVKDGEIRVVRDLPLGSAHMTEALVGVVAAERGEVTIDPQMAEALTRRYGVLAQAPEGVTEEGIPLFQLASLMRPMLEQLLTEVSRFLDFYKVQAEHTGISRLVLCGGGTHLKQLQPFLADGLGLTVEAFNPLIRMPERVQPIEAEQVAAYGPRLAVAVGVALNPHEGLNVLPAETRRARASAGARRNWLRGTKVVGAAALILYLMLQLSAFTLGHQLRRVEVEWTQWEPGYTHAMNVRASRSSFERTIARVDRFIAQQPVWEGAFKALSGLVPSGIELNELVVRAAGPAALGPWSFHLKGKVIASDPAAHGGISKLLEALEHSIFFSEAHLAGSEIHSSTTGTTSFHIEGILQ